MVSKILSKIQTDHDKRDCSYIRDYCKSSIEKLLQNKVMHSIFEKVADSNVEIYTLSASHVERGGPRGFADCINKECYIHNSFNGNNENFESTISMMVHELTHFVMYKHFRNDANPFYKLDHEKKNIFIDITKKYIESQDKAFAPIGYYSDLYKESDFPREFIAYYTQALANDILKGSNTLTKNIGKDTQTLEELNNVMTKFSYKSKITTEDLTLQESFELEDLKVLTLEELTLEESTQVLANDILKGSNTLEDLTLQESLFPNDIPYSEEWIQQKILIGDYSWI